jgi:hypothetical protein
MARIPSGAAMRERTAVMLVRAVAGRMNAPLMVAARLCAG